MKYPKFLRAIYHKYFDNFSIKTVQLRGRLSEKDEKFWTENKNIWKSKNLKTYKNNFKSDELPILEIGFGNGSHLIYLAELYKENLNKNIFGADLYRAGIIVVLKKLLLLNLNNVKIFHEDARETLNNFPDNSLEKIFVLFPDPWRKERHHKRRIIQESFILKCLEKINQSGEIIIASDWNNYTEHINNLLENLKAKKVLNFEKYLNLNEIKFDEKEYNFQKIYETTFAKRAIKEKREITIFKIQSFLVSLKHE
jgi:tRNA (guanine-N7-)-methyltransferase